MNKLINIKIENGKQLVSAKELYLGLGLSKTEWSRWYITNLTSNDYFKENVDWIVRHDVDSIRGNDENLKGGRPSVDFLISIEFAKHIAMMARTEKSHEYRNYFLECEKQAIEMVQPKFSKEVQAIFVLDKRTIDTIERMDKLENNMPLFNVECDEMQALVRKIATRALGGYKTPAYSDNSLRGKVYADIQKQLTREFGIKKYKSIKRIQIETATKILSAYVLPTYLQDDVELFNNQLEIPFSYEY